MSDDEISALFADPVILLSAPRSGSTVLFEQLMRRKPFWTIGGESHAIFRAFPHLRAEDAALTSMALGEAHADAETCALMRRCFLLFLRNSEGTPYFSLPPEHRPKTLCFLEKTPRNALNIPFLLKLFPSARFLFLYRDAKQTVSSLIEAWGVGLQSGRFVTFRDLPDWHLPAWCFLLPRGWQQLRGKPVADIAAFQWCESNEAIIDGLSGLGTGGTKPVATERIVCADYSSFIKTPDRVLGEIADSLSLAELTGNSTLGALPLSRTTVSRPSTDKWRRHEKEISKILPMLLQTQEKIEAFCAPPRLAGR